MLQSTAFIWSFHRERCAWNYLGVLALAFFLHPRQRQLWAVVFNVRDSRHCAFHRDGVALLADESESLADDVDARLR